jgi:hypothetical protein
MTRRRFLRNTAIISGAAVLVDPAWALAASGGDEATDAFSGAGAFGVTARRPKRGKRSDGVFAQVEYGDGRSGPLARWTRLGEDVTLELHPTALVLRVPTRTETTETITLDDFERGRGHHEIAEFFGEPALEQVRTEIAYLRVFPSQFDVRAA